MGIPSGARRGALASQSLHVQVIHGIDTRTCSCRVPTVQDALFMSDVFIGAQRERSSWWALGATRPPWRCPGTS